MSIWLFKWIQTGNPAVCKVGFLINRSISFPDIGYLVLKEENEADIGRMLGNKHFFVFMKHICNLLSLSPPLASQESVQSNILHGRSLRKERKILFSLEAHFLHLYFFIYSSFK